MSGRRPLRVLCGRPLVGQYDRTRCGPPDGRERSSAWHTKTQLLVRRRAASARVDLSGRSSPRHHPKATARRAGQRRRATARRERSHARPARFCGRDEHGEHPPVAPFEHRGTCPVSSWHRRSSHGAASSGARPAADDHGAQAVLISDMARRSQQPRLMQCADLRWETPVSRALMSGLLFAAVPLAIMGVRLHARHQSVRRTRGTKLLSVSPGLSRPQPFPSR